MAQDRITSLGISYPDFKLGETIEPEQFDLNNKQIVDKINIVINAFNLLTQGGTGAGNISITPLPEFPTARDVQTALQQIATFAKANKTLIDSILSKNTQQDSRLTTLESRATTIETKNTQQDGRLSTLEGNVRTLDAEDDRLEALINSLTSALGTRVTTTEGLLEIIRNTELPALKAKDAQHTSDIAQINVKDVEQDSRIANIETREELDQAFVVGVDKKVDKNIADITTINRRLDDMSSADPVAELVEARTSGHTGEVFEKVGKRLDDLEIPIATEVPANKRSKVNFLLTDSTTSEVWEDSVKLGDITKHDASPTAHTGLFAGHEIDATSHNDIRQSVTTEATARQAEDTKLSNQISILSEMNFKIPNTGDYSKYFKIAEIHGNGALTLLVTSGDAAESPFNFIFGIGNNKEPYIISTKKSISSNQFRFGIVKTESLTEVYFCVGDYSHGTSVQVLESTNSKAKLFNTLTTEPSGIVYKDILKLTTEDEMNVLSELVVWKPNNWKKDTDIPSKYPLKSITRFTVTDSTFCGYQYCTVETIVGNAYNQGGIMQWIIPNSWDGKAPIKYRLADGDGNVWSKINALATTDKVDILNTDMSNGWINKTDQKSRISKTGDTVTLNMAINGGSADSRIFTFGEKFKNFIPNQTDIQRVYITQPISGTGNAYIVVKPTHIEIQRVTANYDYYSFSISWVV